MFQKLEKFVGVAGHVTDKAFTEITNILEESGSVINEYTFGQSVIDGLDGIAETVVTIYQVTWRGVASFFELRYQTKTPKSPKDMVCTFSFGGVTP